MVEEEMHGMLSNEHGGYEDTGQVDDVLDWVHTESTPGTCVV